MKIWQNFTSFNIEENRKSNFEKHFLKKYTKTNIVTNINGVDLNTLNIRIYNKLKYFFLNFNRDNQIITFTEKKYKNFEFEFLKIITEQDMKDLMNQINPNSENNEQLHEIRENSVEPIEWGRFLEYILYKFNKDQTGSISSFDNLEEDKIQLYLDLLLEKIKNRKFNFKIYQEKYKKAKKNLMLNALKLTFFTEINHPGPAIIKEESRL